MGEARRKKQLLGSSYGKPLGLSAVERRNLIERNIVRWIGEHLDNCEYYNYLENPLFFQTRANIASGSSLEQVMENVREHFCHIFDRTYPDAAIESLIIAVLKERPIAFEGISFKRGQRMVPIIALPQARKYFQQQVEARKIELPTHYVLVKEALTVLSTPTKATLLKQLLRGEFNYVVLSAQDEQASWLVKNINPDGWIDVDDELLFQSVNRAIVGILTLIATLPWSMQIGLIKLQKIN